MEQFTQIAAAWRSDKRRWVKDATYSVYCQHLQGHILPFMSGESSVSPDTAQRFADSMAAEGLSPKSVRDMTVVLRMILRYGAASGAWTGYEFAVRYPSAASARREPSVMKPSDQRRLLEYLRANFSLRGLGVLISMHSGLRIGEVVGLQWTDLDFEAGVIHVRKTVQRLCDPDSEQPRYFLSVGSPKTASSLRDVPMSDEILRLARPLARRWPPEYFVISGSSDPLEPRAYRDWFGRVLKRLGIVGCRFHTLRHTFATRCIESGCDYKTVSSILGHASISTTLDLYVHPGFAQKKRAIEKALKGL